MNIKTRNLLSIKNESSKESDNDNGDINPLDPWGSENGPSETKPEGDGRAGTTSDFRRLTKKLFFTVIS